MRQVVASGAAALAFASALAPAASAAVRVITLRSPVHRGGAGYLAIQVLTTHACTIRVHHGAAPALRDPGLYAKGPLFTTVNWSWKMPVNAARGRWTIDLNCGTGNTLRTSFLVT